MSYGSIYQVSLTPLTKDDYIDEEIFYENFVGQYATYVNEETDREKAIERLKHELSSSVEWKNNSFKIIDKSAFFQTKFIRFNDAIEKVSTYDLDDFSGETDSDIDLDMFRLNKCYSDKFGTYIYDEDNSTRTIDQFIRQTKENETWYIGNVIGYHY